MAIKSCISPWLETRPCPFCIYVYVYLCMRVHVSVCANVCVCVSRFPLTHFHSTHVWYINKYILTLFLCVCAHAAVCLVHAHVTQSPSLSAHGTSLPTTLDVGSSMPLSNASCSRCWIRRPGSEPTNWPILKIQKGNIHVTYWYNRTLAYQHTCTCAYQE